MSKQKPDETIPGQQADGALDLSDVDVSDLPGAYSCWPNFPMISISMRQRRPLRNAKWVGNVYHGLPLELFPRRPRGSGNYLAFLGRMSRDKRPDRAIEIARRTGM